GNRNIDPDIHLEVLKIAKSLSSIEENRRPEGRSPSNASADLSGLRAQLATSKHDIALLKENIGKDIQLKVEEKSKERGNGNFQTEVIVSDILDAITVDYTPKVAFLEKFLK
ncbi:hypothetical protein QYM36_001973, partial [Artemia franciscana]